MRGPSICAVDLRGLLKVVPEHGAGDKGSEYCIDGFAIDQYGELVTNVSKCILICVRILFLLRHMSW